MSGVFHVLLHVYACVCGCEWRIMLTVATSLNDDYHGRSWSDLESALSAIFNRKPVSVSQEQLFSHVKNMCNHKLATKLYDVLMKAIRDQTKREVGCFQRYILLD